ncbi:hypothetical protein ACLMJK_003838 [Lecanora helva]
MVLNEDEKFAEKQPNFRENAKVHLKHLLFNDSSTLDPKNFHRLLQIFRLEGCLRLDLQRHVPAIIHAQTLVNSLHASGVTSEALSRRNSSPMITFPAGFLLTCLHRKHRIATAKAAVLRGDIWWAINLYLEGVFSNCP